MRHKLLLLLSVFLPVLILTGLLNIPGLAAHTNVGILGFLRLGHRTVAERAEVVVADLLGLHAVLAHVAHPELVLCDGPSCSNTGWKLSFSPVERKEERPLLLKRHLHDRAILSLRKA